MYVVDKASHLGNRLFTWILGEGQISGVAGFKLK